VDISANGSVVTFANLHQYTLALSRWIGHSGAATIFISDQCLWADCVWKYDHCRAVDCHESGNQYGESPPKRSWALGRPVSW
jgi:hypothetical protein